MSVKPLLYGYLRADLAKRTGELEGWVRQIHAFAGAEGFELGTVFREPPGLKWSAFAALLIELKRSECHDVVVPAPPHMLRPGSVSPGALVDLLRSEAHAVVWVADPAARRAATDVLGLRAGGER